MNRLFGLFTSIVFLLTLISPAQAAAPRPCEARLSAGFGVTTYAVTSQKCFYNDQPFFITDMRPDNGAFIYSDKSHFETRSVTIYRPQVNGVFLTHRPVIFFVHGGGWVDGYAGWYSGVARSFTGELGWVTVILDYRLTSNQVYLADANCPNRAQCNEAAATKASAYPDDFNDLADALTWTAQNIAHYGGDPNQIALIGHSSGAHLVSLLAAHPSTAVLRPSMAAVVSMSGIYDLPGVLSDPTYAPAWQNLFNQTFPGGQTQLIEASPQHYLSVGMSQPPTLLLVASDELPMLTAQMQNFDAALTNDSIPHTLTLLNGYTHDSEVAALQQVNDAPTQAVIQFLIPRFASQPPFSLYLPAVQK